MRHCLKNIISVCLVCLFTLGASAQDKRDTTTYFDALQYTMQKRHNKRSPRFVSAPFHDNTFISLYGGTAQVFDDFKTTYAMGVTGGFSLGKWIDDANGIRAGVAWRDTKRNLDALETMTHDVQVSYLYNMTSNKYGDPTYNFCDVLLVAGGGLLTNMVAGETGFDAEAHLGLHIAMRAFNHVDFFVEPVGRFETLLAGEQKFRFAYSINMGLTYNYISKRETMPKLILRKDRFISLVGGVNFQLHDLTFHAVGLSKAMGPHLSLAYGRWYSDLFALRISAFYESNIWNRYMDEYILQSQYFGGRIEGMFEFLHFSPGYSQWRVPMTFSFMLGSEIGAVRKEDIHDTILTPYVGATMALQYKCHIAGPVSFLIEPRVSLIPYNYNAIDNLNTVYTNYVDVVCNLNFGLDFAF